MTKSARITKSDPQCVLILEPEILIRMVVAQYLRECGYTVIEGVQASDFQTLIDSGRQLDVVLADVNLSGDVNGFELSRAIRQTHPNIDVILTSGITGTAEQAHGLCKDGPISKPYHPKDVESRIRILLERRRSSQRS
jgi:DNA-binding response OmpR family regulator